MEKKLGKIVVTGGLGHIGSRLIRELLEAVQVVVVDNLSTQRYCSLFHLPENVRFVESDFTSAKDEVARADAVVHLAATTDASSSFECSDYVWENNAHKAAELARQCAGKLFVFLSTTSVYGKGYTVVREDSDVDPQSPYAQAKLAAEQSVGGDNSVLLRLGTIVGVSPGMRFHTAVNRFCYSAAMGRPLAVWREAYNDFRPYVGLGDAIAAIKLSLTGKLAPGITYNIVTANLTTREVIDYIRAAAGSVDVSFVDTPILNQNSCPVSTELAEQCGFRAVDDIPSEIEATLKLFRL